MFSCTLQYTIAYRQLGILAGLSAGLFHVPLQVVTAGAPEIMTPFFLIVLMA